MYRDLLTFTLHYDEVPDPPATRWSLDGLRWLVFVMNPDDRDFDFVIGVFAFALKKQYVTERQLAKIERISKRVSHAYGREALLCQQTVSSYSRRPPASEALQ